MVFKITPSFSDLSIALVKMADHSKEKANGGTALGVASNVWLRFSIIDTDFDLDCFTLNY